MHHVKKLKQSFPIEWDISLSLIQTQQPCTSKNIKIQSKISLQWKMLLDISLKRKKKKPLMKACNINLQIYKVKNNSHTLMNNIMKKTISKADMTIKRNIKMESWKTRLKKKSKEMILHQDMQKMDGLIINKFTKKAFQASKFLKKSIEILICMQLKFFSRMILKAIWKNIEIYFV